MILLFHFPQQQSFPYIYSEYASLCLQNSGTNAIVLYLCLIIGIAVKIGWAIGPTISPIVLHGPDTSQVSKKKYWALSGVIEPDYYM
jgi:hypothetical protein